MCSGEWCWWFEPASPWRAGRYQLVVDSFQEDLAGNSLVRVFDRDLTLGKHNPSEAHETAIAFTSEIKARAFEKYLKTGSGREFARRHL